MARWIASCSTTLSDLHGNLRYLPVAQPFNCDFFRTVVQQLTGLQLTWTVDGPSARQLNSLMHTVLPDKMSPAYANRQTNIFPSKQPTLDSVNIFSKSSVVTVKTVHAQKFTQLRTLLLSVHSAHQSLVMNTVQYSSCYMILLISICY